MWVVLVHLGDEMGFLFGGQVLTRTASGFGRGWWRWGGRLTLHGGWGFVSFRRRRSRFDRRKWLSFILTNIPGKGGHGALATLGKYSGSWVNENGKGDGLEFSSTWIELHLKTGNYTGQKTDGGDGSI